jgi:hypothetical protein
VTVCSQPALSFFFPRGLFILWHCEQVFSNVAFAAFKSISLEADPLESAAAWEFTDTKIIENVNNKKTDIKTGNILLISLSCSGNTEFKIHESNLEPPYR